MITVTFTNSISKNSVELTINDEAVSSLSLFVADSDGRYASEEDALAQNTLEVLDRIMEMKPSPTIQAENAKVEAAKSAAQAVKEALKPTVEVKSSEEKKP